MANYNANAVGQKQKIYAQTGFKAFCKRNTGFMFILIWLVGFLVFKLYPFMSSLFYSFTNKELSLIDIPVKYGLMNYQQIFSDELITKAYAVTFQYSFITVPLKLVFALFIAYILNYKIKGVNLFRTAYYVPSILGGSVAISVLWKALFSDDGVINKLTGVSIQWLSDESLAVFVISLLRVWQFGSAMVLFLAALKGVSEDLYEAATIDGASKTRQFFSITFPLITPIVFYNLVTQIVQAFQEFNGPYIITKGGPLNATNLIAMLIYQNAIEKSKIGLGSAMAWVLFIIVATLSIIAFVSQKKWVYYGDER